MLIKARSTAWPPVTPPRRQTLRPSVRRGCSPSSYGHTKHPDAGRLVQALFDEQVDRYGGADTTEAGPAVYTPPGGLFLVGYIDGTPATCGGYRTHDKATGTVEIKKMYTVPELRRQGLRQLSSLRWMPRRQGRIPANNLETGVRNTGALALYTALTTAASALARRPAGPRGSRPRGQSNAPPDRPVVAP